MTGFDELLQRLDAFESYLGDPSQQLTVVNYQESLACDEKEALAWSQLQFIQQWGYQEYLIPKAIGGTLDSLVTSYCLTKSIARRDITTAIALALSFFGALPSWIAGSLEQKELVRQKLRHGDILAFALTEEAHGSDLTANQMSATLINSHWQLSGRKWCVNFASQGQATTALCRTNPKGGLLGFSLFFIDKSIVGEGYVATPKLPTHGVRGLDISGFSLDKIQLPENALIGKEQRGLEITYKVFQVSRTLCACLSVGGADTALRLALSFSLQRHLYGNSAYDIPAVKQRLGEQFSQLLMADCTSLIVIRACSVLPKKMSLWSAIIKFLIPKISEEIVAQCAVVIGARAYLRTTEWATFQKIRRDIEVVGLFDGSSQVNLYLIASNLIPQASKRGSAVVNSAQLQELFTLTNPCPDFDPDQLTIAVSSEDDILAGIMQLDAESINPLIALIRAEIKALDAEILQLRDQKWFDPRSLPAFRLAEHYCWLFAASCCLQFWYYNQDILTPELRDTSWLELIVQLVLNKIGNKQQGVHSSELQEVMASYLCTYYNRQQMFGVIPTKLP